LLLLGTVGTYVSVFLNGDGLVPFFVALGVAGVIVMLLGFRNG